MKYDNNVRVRFDSRSMMLIKEVAENKGVPVSVVVRAFVLKGIDSILDNEGNLINEVKREKKET